jgi:hypothetical protein
LIPALVRRIPALRIDRSIPALLVDAKAALKRIECPYAKDKRGNFVTNLCF